MAVPSSSPAKTKSKKRAQSQTTEDNNGDGQAQQPKRTKSPGVRLVGGRIYDSEHGKTCHQCRQKTMDFAASCKNEKEGKRCTLHVCHKCLLNRYGEIAEVVGLLNDWSCPRCRGICNCSLCMKKKGHKPTGILIHAAKATGFNSASELIQVKGVENLEIYKSIERAIGSPKKVVPSNGEPRVVSPRKVGKENSFTDNETSLNISNSKPDTADKKPKKVRREGLKENSVDTDNETSLNPSNSKPVTADKKPKKAKREGLKEKSFDTDNDTSSNPSNSKPVTADKKPKKVKREGINENSFDTDNETSVNPSNSKPVSADKKPKKVKREGLKEISNDTKVGNDTKVDTACSKINSPKRLKVSEKVSKKEMKSKESDGGAPLVGKKAKKVVEDEVSPITVLPDNKKMKNDDPKCEEAVVKRASKDDKKKAKIKDSLKTQEFKKCDGNLELTELEVKPLPKGSILASVWGIDLSAEDVGYALQFLEFCLAFGKVLDVKKGQGISVLRELKRGSTGRRGQYSSAVRFHIQLLSLIQEEMGEKPTSFSKNNSWLQALEKCVAESDCVSKELSSSGIIADVDEYNDLDFSKKLKLLTFLCDEALCTEKLRNWMDSENSKVVEKEKESKDKITVAKNKEKLLKQKLQDDIAKTVLMKNGAPLTISEHDDLVAQIKNEVAQAQSEILRAKGCLAKRKHRTDAVRTEPNFLDSEGRVFWKLRCCAENDILLQDMGTCDFNAAAEKWYIYGSEQKGEIENYISSIREKRMRTKIFPSLVCGSKSDLEVS